MKKRYTFIERELKAREAGLTLERDYHSTIYPYYLTITLPSPVGLQIRWITNLTREFEQVFDELTKLVDQNEKE